MQKTGKATTTLFEGFRVLRLHILFGIVLGSVIFFDVLVVCFD